MNKDEVVSILKLNKLQVEKIDFFLASIIKQNKHTNLIGRSTINNIWERHVLDCLQLTNHIESKRSNILDLGTGAGLPGVLFSIVGYQNVLMIESVKKKTDFIKQVIKELSLLAEIQNNRIEKIKNKEPDVIVSRALAPLNKLLTYALMHKNKNTTLLFLKGRNVNVEIEKAMEVFDFKYEKKPSISSEEGCVLKVNNIKKNV